MKYIKKFENDKSEFEEYSRMFNEKKEEYEKYLDKYLIIQIDADEPYEFWIMKIKEIKGDHIEVYYYSNGSFENLDRLTYTLDFKIIYSFDTFEEVYRKHEEIINDKKDMINKMNKYNI